MLSISTIDPPNFQNLAIKSVELNFLSLWLIWIGFLKYRTESWNRNWNGCVQRRFRSGVIKPKIMFNSSLSDYWITRGMDEVSNHFIPTIFFCYPNTRTAFKQTTLAYRVIKFQWVIVCGFPSPLLFSTAGSGSFRHEFCTATCSPLEIVACWFYLCIWLTYNEAIYNRNQKLFKANIDHSNKWKTT